MMVLPVASAIASSFDHNIYNQVPILLHFRRMFDDTNKFHQLSREIYFSNLNTHVKDADLDYDYFGKADSFLFE